MPDLGKLLMLNVMSSKHPREDMDVSNFMV